MLRTGLCAAMAACAVAAVCVPARPAAGYTADGAVTYRPPVEAEIVDPFRPPPHPYGAGNRGIDYGVVAGTPVLAAAPGVVTFAGPVGGRRHVVVLHADGIRTSYSFLATTVVARGERVAAGQVVGAAGGPLHFGARAGDTYIDPLLLLRGDHLAVHLVPHDERHPLGSGEERAGLVRYLLSTGAAALNQAARLTVAAHERAGDAALAAGRWLRGEIGVYLDDLWSDVEDRFQLLMLALHYAELANPVLDAAHLAAATWSWWTGRTECTPAHLPATAHQERRILVLVGGLGSASGRTGVLDLDTAALGYAAADVVQFSYRGGRVPGVGSLAGVPMSDYEPLDTTDDLRDSGRRLRGLLEAIRHAHPGVPVDVVAHSQGGLVARVALVDGLHPFDPALPEVGGVVTLGTPHTGADLATAAATLRSGGRPGQAAGAIVARISDGVADPEAASVAQLAETSGLIGELERAGAPPGVRLTSIAASGDLVVPALRSRVAGATNVLVPLAGLGAHGDLPGSRAGQREVALALTGMPPTCQGLPSTIAGTVLASRIAAVEGALGAAITYGVVRSGAALGR